MRAVGARGTDVFKIFFSEAFIIAAICIILSIIFTGVFAGLINNSVSNDSGITVSLFNFGFLSVLMITGIALVSAFISTFFPVYFNSKKNPWKAYALSDKALINQKEKAEQTAFSFSFVFNTLLHFAQKGHSSSR